MQNGCESSKQYQGMCPDHHESVGYRRHLNSTVRAEHQLKSGPPDLFRAIAKDRLSGKSFSCTVYVLAQYER